MNKDSRIKITTYHNYTCGKIHNSRVFAAQGSDNNINIQFNILSDDHTPRALHLVEKNKIVITGLKISHDAALALYVALGAELEKLNLL
jgi:hypothetical protein